MYMQDFELDISKIKGAMLLNALEAIKETQDPTLKFRRSCGEGVCGSDGMNINGKNGLACITKLHDLPDRVVLRPFTRFSSHSRFNRRYDPVFCSIRKSKTLFTE